MNENDFGQKVLAFSSFCGLMTLPVFHLYFVPLAIYKLVFSPAIHRFVFVLLLLSVLLLCFRLMIVVFV